MKLGIACLVLGYVLSQFYRAFLAVLSPVLAAETGAGADDLALASGLWFLAFAAMQLPVGWALDRLGPRRTTAWLMGLCGGGGAAIFALATTPFHLNVAMVLIGMGCSPVLMASYYIFGRVYSPAMFATLAGATIGIGTLGNIAGALPLAWAAEAFGWRQSIGGLGVLTALVGALMLRFVVDPPALTGEDAEARGSVLDVLRIPGIWLILPLLFVGYAPAAGLRGLWVGPYFSDVYGLDAQGIGQVTLIMAIGMVIGSFAYGPLDRVFGTRKGVILTGNLLGTACLFALAFFPMVGFWQAALLLGAVGFFGASFPMMMAHGRSYFPPHLTGRGVTFLNLCSVGGVGVLQVISGRVHASAPDTPPEAAYQTLFLFFAVLLLVGCIIYAFAKDRTD